PWKTRGRVQLKKGDSVFLHGGQAFDGTLRIEHAEQVYVGSYGDGSATIRAGDSSGLVLYRVKGALVRGLHLEGAGRKTGNVKEGLMLNECSQILLDSINITGFQKAGLLIFSSV